MQNRIREKNLASLPSHLRELLTAREHSSEDTSVSSVVGQQGWPIGVIQHNEQKLHTNSIVNPWAEAEQWADTLDYKDVMVSFVYGCGFGYPLLEYARRKRPYTETVIFEENLDLFYTMLERIDVEPLLRDKAVHFVIGSLEQMKSQMREILTPEFLLRATRPAAFFTWLAHRNEKEVYLNIHEWVWNTLQLHLSSVGNSVHDSLVGMYNTLDNVRHILASLSLSSLKNAYAGQPAFIVANGPSLDKNIAQLKAAQGKSLILTAESALPPCLKRDIIPDAICITERTPASYHLHFEHQEFPQQLAMVGLSLIDPRIPVAFTGPWVPVFRNGETTSKWIQEAISSDTTGLHGGASSAHLAFEFALWVGANPIVLVGQDLAFGPGQETHSKFSAYTAESLAEFNQRLQSQPTFSVPGVDGGTVKTTKLWYEFKTWFEQQISQHSGTQVIDATEGGAYVNGTILMTLHDAVDRFCTTSQSRNLRDMLEEIELPTEDEIRAKQGRLLQKIKEITVKFRDLTDAADDDIHNCEMVQRACALNEKFPQTTLPAFVESLYQKNLNGFRKYAVDESVVPFTQQVIFAAHKQINDIGEVDSVERLKAVTEIESRMFEYLKKSCQLLTNHFELAETRLKGKITNDES